jgi:nitronate monooxygenase
MGNNADMTWRNRRICDLFGIDHPILLAPMAGSTTPALVAAVSNAGGLGGHGCGVMAPEKLRDDIDAIRAATNRAFQVNFFVHDAPDPTGDAGPAMRAKLAAYYEAAGLGDLPAITDPWPRFDEAALDVVLETRPAVVSFHFGLPDEAAMTRIKDAGMAVISSATTVDEAVMLEKRGVDAVIAQGFEAGGHRGTFLGRVDSGTVGTMALVPQVVDAVDVPVIAAGGIADGRGIAAALMLGAAGVQIGTAFLTSPEAATNDLHRAELLGPRARRTMVTHTVSGRPARGMRNRLLDETETIQDQAAAFPMQASLTGPLRGAGNPEFMALWAGQAAPLNRALPAADLVAALVEETARALDGTPRP